jgi:hypothetical protein
MAHVADHLSVVEVEERYRSCADVCLARHFQTIWLLAQGHTRKRRRRRALQLELRTAGHLGAAAAEGTRRFNDLVLRSGVSPVRR